VLLVPGGMLGDRYGRRRMLRIGLGLFGLTALFSAFAPTFGTLLVARSLQGIAAGLLAPQSAGLLQVVFTGQARAKVLGAMGSSISIATAVGPLLGGLLIGAFSSPGGWRVTFAYDLLALVLLAASFTLPPAPPPGGRRPDLLGTLGLSLTALCLLLPVVTHVDRTAIGWWTAALLLIVALVHWERRYQRAGHTPLLSADLVTNRAWVRGCLVIAAFLAASTTFPVMVSLFTQRTLGFSALQAGLAMIPYAIGAAVGSTLAGRWVLRFGVRIPAAGLVLFGGGLLIGLIAGMPTAHQVSPLWLLLLAVLGFGSGVVITPNQTLSYQGVPKSQASNASGLLLTAQRLGSAFGTALATTLLFAPNRGMSAVLILLTGFTALAVVLTAALSA
jgi:MFS family permease